MIYTYNTNSEATIGRGDCLRSTRPLFHAQALKDFHSEGVAK